MDAAALIIAIIAVFVSLLVAGFAIWLQWLMFRASSDQLANIGKENATLAASIAMSLGQIQKTTTITHDAVSRQMEQVTGRLLDKAFPDRERVAEEAELAEAPQAPVEESVAQWKVRRIATGARSHPAVGRLLTYLSGEDEGKSRTEIREHMASAYEGESDTTMKGGLDLLFALGALLALEALEYKRDGIALTGTGKLAAGLLEQLGTESPPQSAT